MTSSLLFDLDGTLVDSDVQHFQALRRLLARHGCDLDERTYTSRTMGVLNHAIEAEFLPHLSPDARAAELEREYQDYRDDVGATAPIAGVEAVLEYAKSRGIPDGVGSNAPRANAEPAIKAINFGRRMKTLVIGSELEQSKPDPFPY